MPLTVLHGQWVKKVNRPQCGMLNPSGVGDVLFMTASPLIRLVHSVISHLDSWKEDTVSESRFRLCWETVGLEIKNSTNEYSEICSPGGLFSFPLAHLLSNLIEFIAEEANLMPTESTEWRNKRSVGIYHMVVKHKLWCIRMGALLIM